MPTRLSPLIAAVLAILFASFTSAAFAQTTVYQYDSQGRPSGSFETEGIVTGFTYDSGINGLVIASDNNGNSTLNIDDTSGNILESTPTPGALGNLTFDSANGNVTGVSESGGRPTLYQYDGLDRQIRTEQVLTADSVTNGTYNSTLDETLFGTPNGLGNTTETLYDANLNPTGSFDVLGDATSIVFDPGTQDYFVASDVLGTEEVLVYNADGTLSGAGDESLFNINFNSGSGPNGLALGDFEGGPDIVVGVFGNANNSLLLAAPDGSFGPSSTGSAASFFDPLPNVDQANFAGMAVNPRSGAIFIAVTPESSALWLFAPSLCLLALACVAGARRKGRLA